MRIFIIICLLFCFLPAPVAAQQSPLLMAGKTSLYQRILTRPGAKLHAAPEDVSAGEELPPLSIFFVYERRWLADTEWLGVGAASKGPIDGWIRSSASIEWKQTLTVSFTNPADREPALFFRERDQLVALIESEHMVRDIDRFREMIDSTEELPADFPIISIEPETYIDPAERFYLLPILNFEQAYFDTGFETQLLNVAAVTLREGGTETLLEQTPHNGSGRHTRVRAAVNNIDGLNTELKSYRAGIVFAIDTTSSMQPYLQRTRAAVRRIYQRLRESPWGRNLSFGLVAYRDNVLVAPQLEYVTRIAATLRDGLEEEVFFSKVDRVSAAQASSKGFNEDAYAGVFSAIENIDWTGYDGRFVILISDAGARQANDPLSRTRLGAERLRLLAQEKQGGRIALYALHLLTAEGRHTHDYAAAQYQSLTQWDNAGSLYFPVPAGDVNAFGERVDELAASILSQVEQASQGVLVEVPAAQAETGSDQMARKTAIVGRAMQLAYLGRVGATQAPSLFSAWVADRDFVRQSYKTLEVRVLINKNQLSDLQQTLEAILQAGERTSTDAKGFFAQLRSAAARLARDPENVNEVQVRRLADVGRIGEWLDDLPYKSKIMELTENDWLAWSRSEQREFLDEIDEKIVLYEQFHNDTDRWVSLDGRRIKGDAITTIPIDLLP